MGHCHTGIDLHLCSGTALTSGHSPRGRALVVPGLPRSLVLALLKDLQTDQLVQRRRPGRAAPTRRPS
jgi:hypothetical protein